MKTLLKNGRIYDGTGAAPYTADILLEGDRIARIAEELKEKAIELGVDGPYTSWWHMFGWNVFGLLLFGPAVATHRFFGTLNRIEAELNRRNAA